MTSKQIKAEIENQIASMGAQVEVTFINSSEFSICTENAQSFDAAKSLLALAHQKLTGEEHDAECGHFAYYAF